MTASIETDAKEVKRRMREAAAAVSPSSLLPAIGLRQLRWIDKNFRDEGTEEDWPSLRPSTIASRRKGSRKPLQDTGRLRQSFHDFGVRRKGRAAIEVGSNVRTAIYHHEGTDPYVIRPKKAGGVLAFRGSDGGVVFARSVSHPGLPARPLLPSRSAAQKMALDVGEALLKKATGGG